MDVSYVIVTKLVSLEKSTNILISMIKQLMAHFRLTKPISVENVPQIPIDSHEDLDNLEKFLDVKENFEYMVNTLSISGGTTITQITRRIIAKLITNNYATNYNWAGRAPKRAFKSLKTKNLVVETFLKRVCATWEVSKSQQLTPGQLVLIKQQGLSPLQWLTGRVEDVHVGANGVARSATLKTAKGCLRQTAFKISDTAIVAFRLFEGQSFKASGVVRNSCRSSASRPTLPIVGSARRTSACVGRVRFVPCAFGSRERRRVSRPYRSPKGHQIAGGHVREHQARNLVETTSTRLNNL
ncbi:hypothetical protein X777_13197 [Ooceraea biroi]|uniref:DUF5641 domain-containing protein n=1 Tax=Ooceraea biroi TaxID=2015173 RepID=A0A026VYG6_OOCBI|nr:hypothetical protein X777_13197 [Ooceraea biroi]